MLSSLNTWRDGPDFLALSTDPEEAELALLVQSLLGDTVKGTLTCKGH